MNGREGPPVFRSHDIATVAGLERAISAWKTFPILPSFDRNALYPSEWPRVPAVAVLYPMACKFGGDGTLLGPLSLRTGEDWYCTELSLPTRPPDEKQHFKLQHPLPALMSG